MPVNLWRSPRFLEVFQRFTKNPFGGLTMFMQFQVLAVGSATYHSNKLNRDFQRARLMGFVRDAKGSQVGGTADLDFDGSLSYEPKQGEDVLLDVTDLSSKSTLLELRFHSVEPLVARESKQK